MVGLTLSSDRDGFSRVLKRLCLLCEIFHETGLALMHLLLLIHVHLRAFKL